MACYTGQVVTWEQALNTQHALMPENLTMGHDAAGRAGGRSGTYAHYVIVG